MKTGKILSTVTTLMFRDKVPHLTISLAFFVDDDMSHGFISGEGIIWLAKIMHCFAINNLEEVLHEEIEIEQDSKETPMVVKSKYTGEILGTIDPISKNDLGALNTEYENYKMNTKETK